MLKLQLARIGRYKAKLKIDFYVVLFCLVFLCSKNLMLLDAPCINSTVEQKAEVTRSFLIFKKRDTIFSYRLFQSHINHHVTKEFIN